MISPSSSVFAGQNQSEEVQILNISPDVDTSFQRGGVPPSVIQIATLAEFVSETVAISPKNYDGNQARLLESGVARYVVVTLSLVYEKEKVSLEESEVKGVNENGGGLRANITATTCRRVGYLSCGPGRSKSDLRCLEGACYTHTKERG